MEYRGVQWIALNCSGVQWIGLQCSAGEVELSGEELGSVDCGEEQRSGVGRNAESNKCLKSRWIFF